MKRIIFLLSFISLFLFSTKTFSQENIDVQNLNIFRNQTGGLSLSLRTVNSSSAIVTYNTDDSSGINLDSLLFCIPCSFPRQFSTDNFGNSFRGNLGQNNGQIVFHVTSVVSQPIVLSPRISRRLRNIPVRGETYLVGRVEITGINGVIAVDNNVILRGHYFGNFIQLEQGQFPSARPRQVFLNAFSYNLEKAPN